MSLLMYNKGNKKYISTYIKPIIVKKKFFFISNNGIFFN